LFWCFLDEEKETDVGYAVNIQSKESARSALTKGEQQTKKA